MSLSHHRDVLREGQNRGSNPRGGIYHQSSLRTAGFFCPSHIIEMCCAKAKTGVRIPVGVYICYYTSDIHHDFGWILGMLSPSNIRMAHLSLANLEALANTKP